MDIKLNKAEIDILEKADNDFVSYNRTNEKCPRCGNEIIVEEFGNSYTVRCKTSDCIAMDIRGI